MPQPVRYTAARWEPGAPASWPAVPPRQARSAPAGWRCGSRECLF